MLQNIIAKAVQALKNGGLVALPTETVYGLAADASNEDAVKRIFLAKKRPEAHPLIVHIATVTELPFWAKNIPEDAFKLAEKFWPGPITLVLPKADNVSKVVTGGQETIGIRIPNNPITLEILKRFSGGVAAPSANKFGHISPTTALAVKEELGDSVDFLVDGGQCEIGVESTIIDLTALNPVILRPGMVSLEQIEKVLNKKVLMKTKTSTRVSGSYKSHYAPTTKTKLLSKNEILMYVKNNKANLALILHDKDIIHDSLKVTCFYLSKDPNNYAHDLYKTLREVDKQKFTEIIIEDVPHYPNWDGIRDRVIKASAERD